MHSNVCICVEWGRSNNDQSQLRQANNRGVKIIPGLLFSNMSNARGHTNTSPNNLKREAMYLPNTNRKVKISFTSKHGSRRGRSRQGVCPNMGKKCLGSEKVPGEGDNCR